MPTHEKTDFNKLTGLWDNCIDTLAECNKHEAYDTSWADYNKNIILVTFIAIQIIMGMNKAALLHLQIRMV